MEWHKCDICDKSFTGIVSFKQHEASEKHQKKLRLSNGILRDTTNTVPVKTDDQYHCSVCSISVCGMSNYEKHVNSLEHANMIQRKNGINAESSNDQIMLNSTTISTNNSMNVIAAYAECKLCQKMFSGPEPHQQHLASAAHIKKSGMQLSFQMQEDKNVNIAEKEKLLNDHLSYDSEHGRSSEYSSSVALQTFAKCEVCNMQFSGREPYMLHLESSGHKKKSDPQLPLMSGYRCDICNIPFCGPIPYEQHLQGKSHKKKTLERELIKNAGKDFPLPDSTSQNSMECNSGAVQKYYCDICKKQCTGIIPYNSHILSKDHGKNVRIAEMETNMKRIKESGLWPSSGSIPTNSLSRSVELSSTDEVDISNVIKKPQMNDLNSQMEIDNIKKFQMIPDLIQGIAIPNLNIITPESMDVTILGVDEEIVFDSKKIQNEQELLVIHH